MKNVITALIKAFGSLFHSKMLALLLWPMLAATVIWLGAALLFWNGWAAGLTGLLQSTVLAKWAGDGVSGAVSHYLVVLVLIFLLFLAAYLTSLLITAVFTMPAIVNHVAKKDYPDLARTKDGRLLDGLFNTAISFAAYGIGWVLTLPAWLFAPLAIVLSIILAAWLNQRLFRYDALAEHASKEEIAKIIKGCAGKLYILGGIAGLLQFVPVINLFTPVFIGLAFAHLCLMELRLLRRA